MEYLHSYPERQNLVNYLTDFIHEAKNHFPHSNSNPLTIIADIDGTVMDNDMKKFKDMHTFMNTAKKLGYYIVYVTARVDEDDNEDYTKKQLKRQGFPFDELYLMPPKHIKDANFSRFKHQARQNVRNSGKVVIMHLGDNWHDLSLLPPYKNGITKSVYDALRSLPRSLHHTFIHPGERALIVKYPPDS